MQVRRPGGGSSSPSLAFGRPQRLRLTLDCNLLGPAQDHTAKHSQVPNRWNLREVTHTLTGEAADSWPHRSDNWSTWASCGCLRMNSKLFPQERFAGSLDSWRLPNVPSQVRLLCPFLIPQQGTGNITTNMSNKSRKRDNSTSKPQGWVKDE